MNQQQPMGSMSEKTFSCRRYWSQIQMLLSISMAIHENRFLKLHLWHHAKVGCKSSCTTGTKSHWLWAAKALKPFQFQFIKSCSKPFKHLQPFVGWGWSVKYDVKESSPFSSQVMMGGASQARKWFNGREMSNQRNTHRHTHTAGDPWGNWLLPTTLQLHFLALDHFRTWSLVAKIVIVAKPPLL